MPRTTVPDPAAFSPHPDRRGDLPTPVDVWEEDIAEAAGKLRGSGGPCGVTGPLLRDWLLRHEAHSEGLRAELSQWAELLANGLPEYAMYRALNTARQLPAEKDPGVRPLVCGEVWMRLICGVVKRETRDQATEACGSDQLCAGLKCGIEGALHAALAFWPQSAGWEEAQNRAAEEEDAEGESAGEEAEEAAERPLTQE